MSPFGRGSKVDPRELFWAQALSITLAASFTFLMLGSLVMAATTVVARSERFGYAVSFGAAALGMWAVAWLIWRSCRKPR